MPRGRPKKEGRVVTTNIKVTKEAHSYISAAAGKMGLSMSDALILLISEQYPDINEEIRQREARQEKVEKLKALKN